MISCRIIACIISLVLLLSCATIKSAGDCPFFGSDFEKPDCKKLDDALKEAIQKAKKFSREWKLGKLGNR